MLPQTRLALLARGSDARAPHALVRSGAPDIFESVDLFDCYTGKGVPEGKKSLAFNLVYRSPERTLTDDEVEAVHNKLIDALVKISDDLFTETLQYFF